MNNGKKTRLRDFFFQIQFHGSDLSLLHESLSPTILPEEFGGDLGPINNDRMVKAMMDCEEMFKGEFSFISREFFFLLNIFL